MPLAHLNHITKGPLPQANGQPGGAVVWAACPAQKGEREQALGLLTGNRGYDAADTFWEHFHTAALKSASAPKPGLNNSESEKAGHTTVRDRRADTEETPRTGGTLNLNLPAAENDHISLSV